ncbi:MAG: threonylcarbamoyl-AMP synthase [Anaerolineaceae bacterium]|nr:threonylcarbamoyl-AMP synthase [Anaerolineaceae bacterium]
MPDFTTRVLPISPDSPQPESIREAASILAGGGLVAFPTETVYGLGANALDAQAVARIFAAKGRPASDPIIVHLYDLAQLPTVAVNIPDLAYELAQQFWPGPLTLVLQRNDNLPANVSAGMATVAVRMPSHPVAVALLRAADLPIAAPSANRFARPSATTAAHVLEDLAGRIDCILDGGATVIGVESTILNLTKDQPVLLRPGGITMETLRNIIPDLQLVSKHLHEDEQGIEAPGMLYKHYSPRAELQLFNGAADVLLPAMRIRAIEQIERGKRVGFLLPDSEVASVSDLPVETVNLGATESEVSHNLFSAMRSLDQAGVDVILVHGFGQSGLGLALWDRLLRAAEGHIIEV